MSFICFVSLYHSQERIDEELGHLRARNDAASVAKCRERLQDLHGTVSSKLKSGAYAKPGGFQEYQKDINDIQKQYQATTGLGTQVSPRDILGELAIEHVHACIH